MYKVLHVQRIKAALHALLSDRRIPLRDCLSALHEIQDELNGMVDQINDDIERSGEL